ncbi:dienelactone hydrolase [Deinococcus sp. 12RED42]|uniref:alpha/beta hydrolase family protein n=1 Tax=Deinococcus sp. 12RED42 TaxID=2745872 RepID=UPI001E2AE24E|nr:dienelactone hydrolase [Deinococcus sp. 12RED42]MCD0166896.1 dienelactone hydrolase [Deinococcus sp. 12RED42]
MNPTRLTLTLALLLTAPAAHAQTTAPQTTSPLPAPLSTSLTVPGDLRPDAPELAARGQYAVGVRTLELVNPGQQDIVKAKDGVVPTYDRPLTVEVWYPTAGRSGSGLTTYSDVLGSAPDKPFLTRGRANRAAPALKGEAFPLVILSHGYAGSRVLMTYLAENLASKGYVVAAIDHTDSTHGNRAAFASTLLNRALDDNFVISEMARLGAPGSGSPLSGVVNADQTAIVGYSMGGYGALNAAGAGYGPQMAPLIPGTGFATRQAGNYTPDPRIKAVVAFAPWGGDAAVRGIGVNFGGKYGFWEDAGLQNLKVPTLFVVGDRDDVSHYEGGVKPLFENAVNAERYMLVYQNALHNVAPNPAPAESFGNFGDYMHYAEPAWDSARLNNINQHFVTAFLNLKLKGDQSAAEYLNVPVPISNNAKYSRNADGTPKADDTYWKGFKDRTARGMELYRLMPKQ